VIKLLSRGVEKDWEGACSVVFGALVLSAVEGGWKHKKVTKRGAGKRKTEQ
jgi:hypothetical protein